MIYYFTGDGLCIGSNSAMDGEPAIKKELIDRQMQNVGAFSYLEDARQFEIGRVYRGADTLQQYTDTELAEKKQANHPGYTWKMPERVLIDARGLAQAKAMKLATLAAQCDATLAPLKAGYPEGEQQSWDKQETEARALTANPAAPVPLLSALAAGRGIAVADLAARIIMKSDQFAAYSGAVIGKRQKCEDAVAAATTIAQVDAVTWETP